MSKSAKVSISILVDDDIEVVATDIIPLLLNDSAIGIGAIACSNIANASIGFYAVDNLADVVDIDTIVLNVLVIIRIPVIYRPTSLQSLFLIAHFSVANYIIIDASIEALAPVCNC